MGSWKVDGKARLITPTVTEGLWARCGRSGVRYERLVEERAETTVSASMEGPCDVSS